MIPGNDEALHAVSSYEREYILKATGRMVSRLKRGANFCRVVMASKGTLDK